MPDPRLNCAAEICCPPPAAREAKESILRELMGEVDDHNSDGKYYRELIIEKMKELDIEFAPGELMRAIRNLADHPNAKKKESKGDNISSEEAENYELL